MKDQYGGPVPPLVLLPHFTALTEAEVEQVDSADWYEARHPDVGCAILAPVSQIGDISEDDLEGATGVKMEACEVVKIDAPLHRYSLLDGWYHA